MIDLKEIKHPVILFDGVCNLCVGTVQFILQRDSKQIFRFASLQSAFGKNILQQFGLNENNLDSFILLQDQKIFIQSTAALKVIKKLSGVWSLLYVFIVIPAFIRNRVYQFIANHRYKWFGKKNECWLPTKELSNLFIE